MGGWFRGCRGTGACIWTGGGIEVGFGERFVCKLPSTLFVLYSVDCKEGKGRGCGNCE